MKAHHIIAGFSDIKLELIKRTKISKPLRELRLWFTVNENMIFVHDYHDHAVSLILALYELHSKSWKIYLRKHSYGEKLVEFLVTSTPKETLQEKFNDEYRLNGPGPFNNR